MKKIILLIVISITILNTSFVYSQTNHATNVSTSGASKAEPIGWLSGTSNDLDILNSFSNKNIYLWTNDGTSTNLNATLDKDGNLIIGLTKGEI